ncbi:MAG: type II toxin-antitoxin system RelE/ParE family toxin [Thermoanaerobaculia bacterium]
MFEIRFVDSALEDLEFLKKFEQRSVISDIEQHLSTEPATPTRKRKPLRPNALATWELRLGAFRVFYEVDSGAMIVWVMAIGRKEHNRLLIRGKEVIL